MNKYEITFITKEDQKEKPVKKEIEALGGKILSVNSLGQKKFTYSIKKATTGVYTTVLFEMEPTKVIELSKKLSLNPEILRHLILVATPLPAKPALAKTKAEAIKVEAPPKEIPLPPKEKPLTQKPELKEEKVVVPIEKPKKIIKKAAKKIEAEEMTSEERLKALDKKLDELLKE